MAAFAGSDSETTSSTSRVIDSHLHIWASPQEVALLHFVNSIVEFFGSLS